MVSSPTTSMKEVRELKESSMRGCLLIQVGEIGGSMLCVAPTNTCTP